MLPLKINASHFVSPPPTTTSSACRLLITSVMLCLALVLLGGCSDTTPKTKVRITEDEVIVDKSLIRTNNPERYQPSYNLEGALIPIDIIEIRSPFAAHSLEYFVKEGDKVHKNQIVARMSSEISAQDIENADFNFLDIKVKGKENTNTATVTADNDSTARQEATTKDTTTDTVTEEAAKNQSIKQEDSHPDSGSLSQSKPQPQSTQSKTVINQTADANEAEVNTSHKTPIQQTKDENKSVKRLQDKIESTELAIKDKVDTLKNNMNKNNAKDSTSNSESKHNSPQQSKDASNNEEKKDSSNEALLPVMLTFKSPLEGEVSQLDAIAANVNDYVVDSIPANNPFMRISDTRHLQLVGKLPLSAESQLSVGQTANFKIPEVNSEFSGQISHITPYRDKGHLIVRAPVIPDTEDISLLKAGMRATMTIAYGQVELGVRLPRSAIFEADLSELTAKHTRPRSPIHGFVWVILQDQTLDYTPIQVVNYFPESDHFLVHGVNNDSLVCLADLPKDSDGKKLSID